MREGTKAPKGSKARYMYYARDEPEFVSINSLNEAVITLHENNCLAIVDLATLTVTASYTAGTLSLDKIDTVEEDVIDQTSSLDDVKREPDAVAWIDDDHFVTADEGDLDGGSRSFRTWAADPTATVEKTLVKDLVPYLEAPGGLLYEKIEGMALMDDGNVYVCNDNDGVDDNSGETQLLNVGGIL